jgi:hypothetical protein
MAKNIMGAADLMSQKKYDHTHTHTLIHQIKLLLLVSPHSHLRANSVSATKEVGKLLKQWLKLRKQ